MTDFQGANRSPIITISDDGKVEFAKHLTPKEGSEQAWSLLLSLAGAHSSALSALRDENERLLAALHAKASCLGYLSIEDIDEVFAALERAP